ncbi:MAG: ATP F0F1 synthase subunit B [Pseudomonadota bacterium]
MDILYDTDLVVAIGFVLFIGVLVYFKVPTFITRRLDDRAERIRSEIDEARSLREEAQTLLATYERRHKEVESQAENIVQQARDEALAAAAEAKEAIADAIERRLEAAKDQIASAEAAAVRSLRDRAISVAVAAAGDVIAERISGDERANLVDRSIDDVKNKLRV